MIERLLPVGVMAVEAFGDPVDPVPFRHASVPKRLRDLVEEV